MYEFVGNNGVNELDFLGLEGQYEYGLHLRYQISDAKVRTRWIRAIFGGWEQRVDSITHIIEDVEAKIANLEERDDCARACVKELLIYTHGSAGSFDLARTGDYQYDANIDATVENLRKNVETQTANFRRNPGLMAHEQLRRSFLNKYVELQTLERYVEDFRKLAQYMCPEGATVCIGACEAGRGTDGKELQDHLEELFGKADVKPLPKGHVGSWGGNYVEW